MKEKSPNARSFRRAADFFARRLETQSGPSDPTQYGVDEHILLEAISDPKFQEWLIERYEEIKYESLGAKIKIALLVAAIILPICLAYDMFNGYKSSLPMSFVVMVVPACILIPCIWMKLPPGLTKDDKNIIRDEIVRYLKASFRKNEDMDMGPKPEPNS